MPRTKGLDGVMFGKREQESRANRRRELREDVAGIEGARRQLGRCMENHCQTTQCSTSSSA